MRFFVAVLAFTFLAPLVARAEGDTVTAEALFREGRRAADAGDYAIACPRFAESYRLDPEPGTLLNLGDCEENRGQLSRAWEHFRQLYDELPAGDDRKPIADARAHALELRLPKLRIMLLTLPARVTRDDAVLGSASLGVSLPVDPGHHVMVVSAAGRRDKRYDVVVVEGDDKVIAVSSGEPLTNPSVLQPPISERSRAVEAEALVVTKQPAQVDNVQRYAMIGSASAGVACLLAGSIFGVVALTHLSTANAGCVGDVCSSPAALSQFKDAQAFALPADVTIGIGVALIATAVVLAVTTSQRRPAGQIAVRPWIEGRF
jgi:hypothetical protein